MAAIAPARESPRLAALLFFAGFGSVFESDEETIGFVVVRRSPVRRRRGLRKLVRSPGEPSPRRDHLPRLRTQFRPSDLAR
jgi:hypothetical protein